MKKDFWFLNPIFGFVLLLLATITLMFVDIYKRANQITPIVIKESPIIEAQNLNSLDLVIFNPKSLKFHKHYCEWAKKCRRCIKIPKSEAVKQGGIPCKVCGKIR